MAWRRCLASADLGAEVADRFDSRAASSVVCNLIFSGHAASDFLETGPRRHCGPRPLMLTAGLLVAQLCGAKSWLHLQDFEVDVAFRTGLLKGKLLQRIVLRMERWILRRFDNVSSISNRMVERLIAKGVKPERTKYFPNWVDIAHIKPSIAKGVYRAELGVPDDATVVLSSGTLGGKQGLMAIPKVAIRLAHRKDILFVICGDGVMKPSLKPRWISGKRALYSPATLCASRRTALHGGYPPAHAKPHAADLVLPSKLSGMLASARPVIATCHAGTELESVVSKCGQVVAPGDIAALADAVCKLADEPATRTELGRRGRAYAEKCLERDEVLASIFGQFEETERVADDVAHRRPGKPPGRYCGPRIRRDYKIYKFWAIFCQIDRGQHRSKRLAGDRPDRFTRVHGVARWQRRRLRIKLRRMKSGHTSNKTSATQIAVANGGFGRVVVDF